LKKLKEIEKAAFPGSFFCACFPVGTSFSLIRQDAYCKFTMDYFQKYQDAVLFTIIRKWNIHINFTLFLSTGKSSW
jgi:hypothetical protein